MTGCTVVGGDVVISAGQDEVREVTAHLEVLVDGQSVGPTIVATTHIKGSAAKDVTTV